MGVRKWKRRSWRGEVRLRVGVGPIFEYEEVEGEGEERKESSSYQKK